MLKNSCGLFEWKWLGECLCTSKVLFCTEALTTPNWSVASQVSHGTSEWEALWVIMAKWPRFTAQGSNGAPSHLEYLHPMSSMTRPDGNVVVQIQTHVLKPGKSQKLQQKGHPGSGSLRVAAPCCKERQAGCTVLRGCSTKQQNGSKLAPRSSNHQL